MAARATTRKGVVQFVGHTGQQRAERGELLALVQQFALPHQLFRGTLLLGDVASDGEHVRP